MSYDVKILADSIASGVRLTTVQATFPRFILAEVNTHRMLSRNSASSRAIPVEKNIERVMRDPFYPEAFGANQRGMQAGEALHTDDNTAARVEWLVARDHAVDAARALVELGVHKQWANRLLEPYAWHTAIISATEWDNFFLQRCHPAASPEFRRIAEMIREAMAGSAPQHLEPGQWHLPLVELSRHAFSMDDFTPNDLLDYKLPIEQQVKISVARCARVSYLTHEGKRDVDADLALYEKLVTSEPKHLSPLEHAARVVDPLIARVAPFFGNFASPWWQHRKDIAGEDGVRRG